MPLRQVPAKRDRQRAARPYRTHVNQMLKTTQCAPDLVLHGQVLQTLSPATLINNSTRMRFGIFRRVISSLRRSRCIPGFAARHTGVNGVQHAAVWRRCRYARMARFRNVPISSASTVS
jgi:hypothetical protein